MAQLYFIYGSMNSGKTTELIQTAYNYNERGMKVLTLKPQIDTREGIEAVVRSRIGGEAPARLFSTEDSLYDIYIEHISTVEDVKCVLIDEAQFLTPEQVNELCSIVDYCGTPVMAFGLRTDFLGNLFPGSAALLSQAEKIRESKTICRCGSKATHVVRVGVDGYAVFEGAQVAIGGNDLYEAVCRKCHGQKIAEAKYVKEHC